jgi:16S rRNA (guanine527-N7)-methyltransferase
MDVDVLDSEALGRRLSAAGAALGLVIGSNQCMALLKYISLLERWNAVHSLSAHESRADLLVRLVFDGFTLSAALARWAERAPRRILDVGTGAGFPAVVLAVMNPGWSITAVDPSSKKTAFVRQAAGDCSIHNLRVVQARVEDVSERDGFDAIVSRAFGSLCDVTKASASLLAPDGIWVIQKGRYPAQELAALGKDVDVFHVEPVKVPEMTEERCLVWMRRAHDER